jgi:hypothetical protein
VKFRAELHGVASHYLGKIIEPLKCIVDLLEFVGIRADGKGVEDDILHPFAFRI